MKGGNLDVEGGAGGVERTTNRSKAKKEDRHECLSSTERTKSFLLRCFDDDADVLGAAGAGHVEERHRRLVVDVGRALEEHHLAGVAVQDLAHALGELVDRDVV